ncbi:LPS export ABC transporter periplasmic protein LptC [Rubidibacter lacunae]|nr:LPS export ABC transporter periplasmic protein LptC [Rubidibacter lacunae]
MTILNMNLLKALARRKSAGLTGMKRRKWHGARTLSVLLAIALAACRSGPPEASSAGEGTDNTEAFELEKQLVLQNATLNQADDNGEPLWRIHADLVTYSPDRRDADLENLTGNLYEDGEIALQIVSERGRIVDAGELVRLEGEVIATDVRNELSLHAEIAEWFPERDLLIVRQNLRGTHSRFEIAAREGHYQTLNERLELRGEVLGLSEDPPLRLQAERLFWSLPNELVTSEDPIAIERYQEDVITDRVDADRAAVDLATREVRLNENVTLRSTEPPMQIVSNAILWLVDARLVLAEEPVRADRRDNNTIVTGDRGEFDLENEVATLEGRVEGTNRDDARLFADRLEWDIPGERVEATGNVIYEQSDPPVTTAGETAVGNLAKSTVVVRSGNAAPVVTEFMP